MASAELEIITFICGAIFVLAMLLATAIRVVPENQRLSLFRLGRYVGDIGPGLVFVIPFLDRTVKKDVQDQVKQLQDEREIWGEIGNTVTTVHAEGEIEISGEMWSATSKEPIPPGTKVRVTSVILEVERV